MRVRIVRIGVGLLLFGGWCGVGFGEMRTWRSVGGYTTEAAFVSYEGGVVTLRKKNGEQVSLRIEQLHPAERMEVIQQVGSLRRGVLPAGAVEKPTGRRELTWEPMVREDPWPDSLSEGEREALESVGRTWNHVETLYFFVHYQELGFARRVARMADFQYPFIAADLPGFRDRLSHKSHIVVLRDENDWREFLWRSGIAPRWSAAFVRGDTMFLHDLDDQEQSAGLLAHEMSHLVLNRFFARRPPLWLNEGLAEWYGNMGHEAFKGQKVDPEEGMREFRNPMTMAEVTGLRHYPEDPLGIHRYYQTSKQVVGMLMFRKDQPAFVRFLQGITVEGRPFLEPLAAVYGLESVADLQAAYDAFLLE